MIFNTDKEKASRAASKIRLLALDVDGILTDGRLFFSEHGEELKAFHTLDGHGIKMLQENDIEVAIIGCYVNGPGESKAANIGLTGASPSNLLYIDGAPNKKISNANLVDELEDQVRKKLIKNKIESEKIILRS